MNIRRIPNFLADMWQPLLLYGGLFGAFGFLLYARLGTLLPGYSTAEVQNFQASASLEYIFNHPFNAPFMLITNGLTYFSNHSYLLTRVAATIFGLVTLGAFCWLLQHWYGRRAAIIGTILFASSAWFLHTARMGTPDVLLFGVVTLVACGVWLKKSSNPVALLLCFAIIASLLYVPGMIWLLALGALWYFKTIDHIFKRHLWIVSVGAFMLLAAIGPIAWAIYRTPELWKTYFGFPAEGWPQLMEVLRNLYEIPLSFFLRYPDSSPDRWLGTLPILDVFTMAMVFLGGYVCIKHWRLKRVRLLGAILLIGIVLASLGGSVSPTIIVPFVYILAAVGISFLLERWYTVFPRNPIAQGLGIGLVSLAVVAACAYSWRHYYVAWPLNNETRTVYTVPELPASVKIEQ